MLLRSARGGALLYYPYLDRQRNMRYF